MGANNKSFLIIIGISLVLLLNTAMTCSSENESASRNTPASAPAAPNPGSISQPDGSVINIYLKGDEWCNWLETDSGYTIAKAVDGYFYYVSHGEGDGPDTADNIVGVELTNVKAHEAPPDHLPKDIRPSCASMDRREK